MSLIRALNNTDTENKCQYPHSPLKNLVNATECNRNPQIEKVVPTDYKISMKFKHPSVESVQLLILDKTSAGTVTIAFT